MRSSHIYIYIYHRVDRDSRNSFEDIRAFENVSILLSAVLGVVYTVLESVVHEVADLHESRSESVEILESCEMNKGSMPAVLFMACINPLRLCENEDELYNA